MEKKFDDNDEIQIDLLELAYALKKKLWLIILGLIVGAFGAGLYSKILLTPIYKSTAMVYVLSKETTLTSLADLQIGSQLTKDYSVLVTSRPVLEQVIEKQQLDMRVDELERMISIGNPTDTRVLTITISDTDPIRAQALAEEVAKTSSDYGNGSAQDHRGRRTGRKTKFSKCEKECGYGRSGSSRTDQRNYLSGSDHGRHYKDRRRRGEISGTYCTGFYSGCG